MATRLITGTIILLSSFSMLAQKGMANSGAWSGIIINSGCTADEAFAEAAKCAENRGPGAELVLYDDTTRQIYTLAPQDQAIGHLGGSVTVNGALRATLFRLHPSKCSPALASPWVRWRLTFPPLTNLDASKASLR